MSKIIFGLAYPIQLFLFPADETVQVNLTMNVEEWFENPNIFDFNYWGGNIMENQAAMKSAKENGHNVFEISKIVKE